MNGVRATSPARGGRVVHGIAAAALVLAAALTASCSPSAAATMSTRTTAAPVAGATRSAFPSVSPTATPTATPTPTPTRIPTAPPRPTSSLTRIAGPAIMSDGDSGVGVRELQARLARAGVFAGAVADDYGPVTRSAVRRYQVRLDLPVTGAVDARTLSTLRSRTTTPTRLEMYPETAARNSATPKGGSASNLDSRCLTGRVLCADKSRNTLSWVVDGTVQMTLSVRFGRPSLPTTNGVWSVYWKDVAHRSSLYNDAPMPYAMFFHGGEAVHYSTDFVAQGYGGPGGSHGCINTRSRARTALLFSEVRVGDKVVVYS